MHVCVTPDEVAERVGAVHSRLIAIDGFHGSGKTTLARTLAGKLRWRLVGADEYLNQKQGGFFNHLRLDALQAALLDPKPCIFDGICALKVLEAVQLQPDLLIYVKRMSKYGWAEAPDLEAFQGQRLYPEPQAEPLQIALRTLWVEVCSYHIQFQPHLQAAICYERSAA